MTSQNIAAGAILARGEITAPAVGIENIGNNDTTDIVLTFATESTLTNPTLTNETTGVAMTYNGTITYPETIVVNVKQRTAVRTSDGANMVTLITWTGSKFYMVLAPGHNDLRLTGTGAGSVSVQHRSARFF